MKARKGIVVLLALLALAAVFTFALAQSDGGPEPTPPTPAPTPPTPEPVPATPAPVRQGLIPMVEIPAGRFLMGSPADEPGRGEDEGPQHWVTISRAFLMGKTEVTNAQYLRFVEATNTHHPEWMEPGSIYNVRTGSEEHYRKLGAALDAPNNPAVGVSWRDAIDFADWLSGQEGLSRCYSGSGDDIRWDRSCNGYRLPTEAEWEYAARAGTTTPFHTGRCLSTDQANYAGDYPYEGCPQGVYRQKTVRAGSFAPNAWGLFNMHGNVMELVWDRFGAYVGDAISDPAGPYGGLLRVVRGGGWGGSAQYCRSAVRYYGSPGQS